MGLLHLKLRPDTIREIKRPGPEDGKGRTFDRCVIPSDRAKQILLKRKIHGTTAKT